jgi:outer membrane protein OmpA-like peptidoglycan-associated protein
LNSKKTSNDTLIIEKESFLRLSELIKDSFKSEVLFNNNSKVIQENQMQQLDEVVNILKSTEKIDVYLKGSLANKRQPVYNQNLFTKN